MAIVKGDYLGNFLTIFIVESPVEDLKELYDKFILQCGPIQKVLEPAFEIQVSLNEKESSKLKYKTTCYLAGITKTGHKETFQGSCTFEVQDNKVLWEPVPERGSSGYSAAVVPDSDYCRCGVRVRFAVTTYDSTKKSDLPTATTIRRGIARVATDEEAIEGISNDTMITPRTLRIATHYTHDQAIASDRWVIEHNLNKRPSCHIVDSAGNIQMPNEIIYDSDNQVTIYFISPFAGYAYLN